MIIIIYVIIIFIIITVINLPLIEHADGCYHYLVRGQL